MVRKAMNREVVRPTKLSFTRTLEEKGEEQSNRHRRLRTLKKQRKTHGVPLCENGWPAKCGAEVPS